MTPGRYTELFFLDEATALAAGHRPCAECRREDYTRLTEFWAALHPNQHGADAIDAQLHAERIGPKAAERRLHEARFNDLPDGVFILHEGTAQLVLGAEVLVWSASGYAARRDRPTTGRATVITPPSLVALLRGGWAPLVPLLHPTAGAASQPGHDAYEVCGGD